MPSEFEPYERQKRLMEEATRLTKRDSGPSRFAPEELVTRMTSEGLLVSNVDYESSTLGRDEFSRLEQPRNVEAQLPQLSCGNLRLSDRWSFLRSH